MKENFAHLLLILSSVAVFGLFLYTVFHRIDYPYDLEWMEGGMLIHALRVTQGQGLYVEPSSDFIPYIYPPMYSWILAGLSSVFELGYGLGRGVSVAGTVLTIMALIAALREEHLGWPLAVFGGALFCSTYEDTGTFLDLTRADSCTIAALSWSLVAIRKGAVRSGGALLCLAFLFKHNAAIFGFPCLWWLWRQKGRESALRFVGWSAVPALLAVGWLQWSSDGYFLTYLLGVPTNHPIVAYRLVWLSFLEMASSMWLLSLIGSVWISWRLWQNNQLFSSVMWGMAVVYAFVLAQVDVQSFPVLFGSPKNGVVPFAIVFWLLVLVAGVRTTSEALNSNEGYWLLNGLVALAFSALMRGHHGGFTNVLMPGCWMFALWSCLVLYRLSTPWLVTVLGVGQLYLGIWQPAKFIPTPDDRAAGDELVDILRNSDGPIFAPHSPWLAVTAGHPPTSHLIAIWDIDHPGGVLESSVAHIRSDIANHRWGAVVSANERLGFGLKKHYRRDRIIRPKGSSFYPKIGWKVRPSYLYVPKE